MSIQNLVEKVKLKLNLIEYDGDVTIPDDIIEKHLETAKTLIDSVFDVSSEPDLLYLYEECVTEFAKYLTMVSWAANAIDVERTPNTWTTILKTELRILKALLLQLLGDELTVNQILGEATSDFIKQVSIPLVASSYNMLTRNLLDFL